MNWFQVAQGTLLIVRSFTQILRGTDCAWSISIIYWTTVSMSTPFLISESWTSALTRVPYAPSKLNHWRFFGFYLLFFFGAGILGSRETQIPNLPKQEQKPKYLSEKNPHQQPLIGRQELTEHVCRISGSISPKIRHWTLNPIRTAVPFWGLTTQISSSLSPKRDCGFKRVEEFGALRAWTSLYELYIFHAAFVADTISGEISFEPERKIEPYRNPETLHPDRQNNVSEWKRNDKLVCELSTVLAVEEAGPSRAKKVGRQHFYPLTDTVKANVLADSLDSQNPGTLRKIPVLPETPENIVGSNVFFIFFQHF